MVWPLNNQVCEKHIIWTDEDKQLWKKWHFVENKTGIRQHVLKIQQISLLPKYIKLISRGVYLMCICVCECRLTCNRPLTLVQYVYLHCFNFTSFLMNHGQSIGLQCVGFYAQLGADFPNCQLEIYPPTTKQLCECTEYHPHYTIDQGRAVA